MKPLQLRMSAFGPFAEIQTLDFAELGERSFFLIHGPTGAGKTTILDAICFALYGDTSGAQRDGKQMRSDYADPEAVTEVIFDFSIAHEVYRVKRQPEQKRPKKHGPGTTLMRSDATLWKRTGLNADDAQEGMVLASGGNKVNVVVENLLGFKSGQFRQVVMLPQGEFRKLLVADSRERQVILETLFHIELYRLVEERLKMVATELRKKVGGVLEQRKWVLQQAGAEAPEELSQRLQDHEQELASLEEKVIDSRQAVKKAQDQLTDGQKARELLEEQNLALIAVSALEEKAPAVEMARQELSGARLAAGLVDAESAWQARRSEGAAAEQNLASRLAAQQTARQDKEKAQLNWSLAKDREPEREAAAREVNRLEMLAGKVAVLISARQELRVAEQRSKSMEAVCTQAKAALIAKQSVIEEKIKLREEALAQTAQAGALEAAYREAEQISCKRQLLEEWRQKLNVINQTLAVAKQTCRQVEEKNLRAKEELAKLQQAWHSGQAALLADVLTAGTPCPVCGSLEHPAPASSTSHVPSEEDVKAWQEQLDKIEVYRDKVFNKANQVVTEKATIESKVVDLVNELGERANAEPAALVAYAAQAKQVWHRAGQAEAQVAALGKELESLKAAEKAAREHLDLLEKELQESTAFYKSAQAVMLEREAAVPEALRDQEALNKAKDAALSLLEQLVTTLEQARHGAEVAGQEFAKAETAAAEAQNTWEAAKARATEAAELFHTRLAAAGFSTAEEYGRAKRTAEQIQQLEKSIQTYDTSLGAARDRRERAVLRAAGFAEPDLNQLAGILQQAENIWDSLIQLAAQLRELLKQEQEWLQALAGQAVEIQTLEHQYAVWGHLAEVANGKNNYGLTFQRFVLGALLDDVTVAATERLKLMSSGRYQLQRTLERARSNAAGGLELEVFDAYTGVARGVATLSGGETFLASLSLALGLADVVQSYSGGIHLDTIFVDEGFGTLDPESLDLAMRALMDLQKGGRLVGIISHVPELKEIIDARLEIQSTKQGSNACFKIS